jgi:hypothetical protein
MSLMKGFALTDEIKTDELAPCEYVDDTVDRRQDPVLLHAWPKLIPNSLYQQATLVEMLIASQQTSHVHIARRFLSWPSVKLLQQRNSSL